VPAATQGGDDRAADAAVERDQPGDEHRDRAAVVVQEVDVPLDLRRRHLQVGPALPQRLELVVGDVEAAPHRHPRDQDRPEAGGDEREREARAGTHQRITPHRQQRRQQADRHAGAAAGETQPQDVVLHGETVQGRGRQRADGDRHDPGRSRWQWRRLPACRRQRPSRVVRQLGHGGGTKVRYL